MDLPFFSLPRCVGSAGLLRCSYPLDSYNGWLQRNALFYRDMGIAGLQETPDCDDSFGQEFPSFVLYVRILLAQPR